jgi:hypothetical protein
MEDDLMNVQRIKWKVLWSFVALLYGLPGEG